MTASARCVGAPLVLGLRRMWRSLVPTSFFSAIPGFLEGVLGGVLGGCGGFMFFSAILLYNNRIRFPRVSGGFLERFGSLERMGKAPPESWVREPALAAGAAVKLTGDSNLVRIPRKGNGAVPFFEGNPFAGNPLCERNPFWLFVLPKN